MLERRSVSQLQVYTELFPWKNGSCPNGFRAALHRAALGKCSNWYSACHTTWACYSLRRWV